MAFITKETELDPDNIQNWAKCLRWRMKNNRGIASVEDYLKASEEALIAQVVSYEIFGKKFFRIDSVAGVITWIWNIFKALVISLMCHSMDLD